MKLLLKILFKKLGFKISKMNSLIIQNENPFIAVKSKIKSLDVIFFDIGVNQGQTIKKMLDANPSAKVYGFEPSRICFKFLEEEFLNTKNINLYNSAIGSQLGELSFNEYSWSALNSILTRAYGTSKIIDTYLVNVLTIDYFFEKNQIPYINLLKTDTEGYELNVLRGAANTMDKNKIQFVLVEIFFNENYIDQASFGDIYNFLLSKGFELVRFYDILYTDEGLASKTDALFYNKEFLA